MDWAILIFEILLTVAVFLIGLFVKNYLPSYMDEKGKNLATKEDIEEITRKTEEVQQEFREGFELFSNDVKFKYDFFYKQYSELYCKLYAIIIQSEYVRHFIELTDKRNIPFEEAPFLEITPTHKETTTFNISKANGSSVTRKTEEIETPISQFNKKELCDYIWKMLIDKGMNKKELRELSGISTASMAKLGKGENITTDVLLRICTALNCQISDILETLPDEETEKNEELREK